MPGLVVTLSDELSFHLGGKRGGVRASRPLHAAARTCPMLRRWMMRSGAEFNVYKIKHGVSAAFENKHSVVIGSFIGDFVREFVVNAEVFVCDEKGL